MRRRPAIIVMLTLIGPTLNPPAQTDELGGDDVAGVSDRCVELVPSTAAVAHAVPLFE